MNPAHSDPSILLLLALLLTKHLIADFLLQTPAMLRDKGDYARVGGVLHAALHGALSLPVLLFCDVSLATAAILSLTESAVHYHIDWTKEFLSRRWNTSPSDRRFWIVMGGDQFAHQLTYVAMVAAIVA